MTVDAYRFESYLLHKCPYDGTGIHVRLMKNKFASLKKILYICFMNLKYTKETLLPFCQGATTVRQVFINLGLKSQSNKRLYNLIKEVLVQMGTYKGLKYKVGKRTPIKSDTEFFRNDGTKKNTWSVRNALFNRGLKEKKCECCDNSEWNGKPIPLEVHHKNGNKFDNELSNLEILCPNCHYFTDTYKTKNIKAPVAQLEEATDLKSVK